MLVVLMKKILEAYLLSFGEDDSSRSHRSSNKKHCSQSTQHGPGARWTGVISFMPLTARGWVGVVIIIPILWRRKLWDSGRLSYLCKVIGTASVKAGRWTDFTACFPAGQPHFVSCTSSVTLEQLVGSLELGNKQWGQNSLKRVGLCW